MCEIHRLDGLNNVATTTNVLVVNARPREQMTTSNFMDVIIRIVILEKYVLTTIHPFPTNLYIATSCLVSIQRVTRERISRGASNTVKINGLLEPLSM
jgi:hypothetical protein